LWQKAILSALYGFVSTETGNRRYRRLHIYVGRKNGKTLFAACIIIYEMLMGGEYGAEFYTGATKRDQAKITWDIAKMMIVSNPALNERFRITLSGIYLRPWSETYFMPVSKESKKLDGLNAYLSHIDELHAIVDNNIIDVMWDSTKTRQQPIELITTTMGTERQATFDDIYTNDSNVVYDIYKDERLLVFCYELDDVSEWKNIHNAYKANPNLGISIRMEDIYEEIEKAKNDASKLINLLCKTFNIRQTNRHAWLSFEDFDNNQKVDLKQFDGAVVIGGFDLSRTGDLTAFTTLFFDRKLKKLVAETMYWCTQKYHDNMTKVPIKLWVQQGYIRISGEELINYRDIVDYVKGNYETRGWRYMFINYDSYSAGYLVNDLEALGYAKNIVLIPTPQGAKTLSIPMQEMEAELKQDNLLYQDNPVTKWCLSNAEVEKDRNGNYLLKKGSYEQKIDGVSTILNCMVSYIPNKEYFMNGED
jgi:phage terminase large subunit-like protein